MALLDSISKRFGLYELDRDQKITLVNETMENIVHKKADELIGKPWQTALKWTESSLEAGANARNSLHKDSLNDQELKLTFYGANDRLTTIHIFVSLRFDETKKFIGYEGFVKDITEDEKRVRELSQNETRFKNMQIIGDIGFCDIELEVKSKEVHIYPEIQWQEITGIFKDKVDLDEYLENLVSFENFYPPDMVPKILEGVDFWQNISQYRHPHKGLRWLKGLGQVIERTPDYIRIHQLLADVTEEKEALEKQKEQQKKLETLVEKRTKELLEAQEIGGLGSWYINYKTGKSNFSRNLISLHGQDPDIFKGTLNELIVNGVPEDRKRLRTEIEASVKNGTNVGSSTVRTIKDNKCRYFRLHWKAKAKNGELQSVRGTTQEITEQVLLENRLKRKNSHLKLLLETMPDAVVLVDKEDLSIISANKKAKEYYKIDNIEGVSCMTVSCSPEDSKERLEESLNKPVYRKHISGDSFIDVEISSSTFNMDGEREAYLVVVRDISDRKKLEREVCHTQNRLQEILDTVPVGIFWKDLNSVYVGANRTFIEDSGCRDLQHLLGKKDTQLPWAALAEKFVAEDRDVMFRNRSCLFVEEFVAFPDRKRWVRVCKVPTYDTNQKVNGILGTYEDITVERTMKQKLEQSEHKFRTVANYTYDWEYWIDPEGTFVYMAPSVERITGYSAKSFEGLHYSAMLEIVHPDDRDSFAKHINEDLHCDCTPYETDFRIYHADGSIRWIAHACQPIIDEGIYLGHRASNRDVTENKELQLKVEESERRLSQIANSIDEIFWLIDPDGTIRAVNPSFKRLFMYDSVDDSFWNLRVWAEDEKQRFQHQIQHCFQNGEYHFITENNWTCADGSVLICRNSITLVVENRKIINIVIVTQDITKFKEWAKKEELQLEQLRQADKMTSLGILISGVAHEINNPNNLIMLNAALIGKIWVDATPILDREFKKNPELRLNNLKYSLLKEKVPNLLESISMGSDRIKGIVHSLKEFARVDSGSINDPVDMTVVISSAIRIVRNEIKKSTHNFTVNKVKCLPFVRGNKQQLEQVVINLITNACQALKCMDDVITLSITPSATAIEIRVADSGIGMDEDILEKLYDPFFTTKREAGGTGLGLSVSHSIIKSHKGTLRYESHIGIGTTAIVELPIIENVAL